MGVSDIRAALQKATGQDFAINDVTLRYRDGGKKQIIEFMCKNNKLGVRTKMNYVIEGDEDPVIAATRIGTELAADSNGE